MKYVLPIVVLTFAPFMAGAQVYSNVNATANTGGNTAGEGGKVETGDASASAHTQTTNTNGTSVTEIRTEVNGNVQTQTVEGEGSVDVSVNATPTVTDVTIVKNGEVVLSSTTVATTTASSTVEAQASAPSVVERVWDWLLDVFIFW
ncbi:hypothetical protein IT396_02840 [Candidatus Nomurabacteria bacterium]|nr:hypothetical protein [Candidatus Nomurabacteria bacterium]